jgi:hypothetical protein
VNKTGRKKLKKNGAVKSIAIYHLLFIFDDKKYKEE